MKYIVADPILQEIASFGFYSSYYDAFRRCEILNRRAGAPEKPHYTVCQLTPIAPPNVKDDLAGANQPSQSKTNADAGSSPSTCWAGPGHQVQP